MIGNAPRSHITGVPGWESPAEQELLVRLAQDVSQNGVIVEIGAEYGMSASLFWHGASTRYIFSVEIEPKQAYWQNLSEYSLSIGPAMIHGDSSEIGFRWPEIAKQHSCSPELDLLFVDGDHSYRGCKADILAWFPHVKVGGRIAFHDTACETNKQPHPLHHEVSHAIADWQQDMGDAWVLIETVDSVMVFERRL